MRRKNLRSGITLLEAVMATAITVLIGTALVTMAITTLTTQQSSTFKNLATRCAETKVEEIKNAERVYRSNIQNGDWSNFPNGSTTDYCPYNSNTQFFTRVTTFTGGAIVKDVEIVISWVEKGRYVRVRLVSQLTKWL